MLATTVARVKWLSGLVLLLVSCGLAASPAWSQVRPIVTDQAALSLSSTYWLGLANGLGVRSANGDVAFTDDGRGAIFLKRAGMPSFARLLQTGDAVPGIPNSYIELFFPPRINATGVLCLQVSYVVGTVSSSAILTYNGTTFDLIATGADAVPGMPGEVFGRVLTVQGFNDDGDVAFTAPLIPLGSLDTDPTNTLFLVPAGGAPIRVAGVGDVATGTGGLTIVEFTVSGFNSSGEVLFSAKLTDGSATSYGFFVGSNTGVRKIVAHGDAKPGGGTLDLSTSAGTAYLNNLGHVAYADPAKAVIYIHTKASGLTAVVTLGTAVPAELGVRTLTQLTLNGFNESGTILFAGLMTGSGYNNALFRYITGSPLDLVAHKDQEVPDAAGVYLYNFGRARMNEAGDVAFYSSQPTSSTSIGVFKKGAGDSLRWIMLNGYPTGLSGGGVWSSPTYLALGEDGVVYVETAIVGGTARACMYSNAFTGFGPIVTSADALPAGSRVTFRNIYPAGAGEYALFQGQYAGGAPSLFVHHVGNAATTRVAGIGDAAPAGGTISALLDYHQVYVTEGGTVTFGGSVSGTSGYLFAWNPATGLVKVAGPGDVEPSSGNSFTGVTLPTGAGRTMVSPANAAGQIVFRGSFIGTPSTTDAGLYVATPTLPLGKIVRANTASPYGDAAPSGGQFYSISRWMINNQGLVAFQGQTRTSDGNRYDGIFVGSTTGTLQTVWIASAPTSAATKASLSAFDHEGRVIFFAPGSGGLTHLYVGTGGGTPVAIAANGTAAPAGGTYAFTTASIDAKVNALGDIVFQAPLSGGTAETGLFLLRRATGLVEAIAVEGQTAPDTGSTFAMLPPTINMTPGEMSAIGPTGEVLFWAYVEVGGVNLQVVYRYGLDKTLEKVAQRGETAASSGGGVNMGFSQGLGAGRPGLFVFRANVVGGTFRTAIYATRITPLITWPTPSGITHGTALSATQLNATADVPGTLTYDPPAGTVLAVGQRTLSVAFTPADLTVYTAAAGTVTLTVTGSGGGTAVVPSDFGGDGKSDILWHHATRGEVWLWPMSGASSTGQTHVRTVGEAGWAIRGVGDFGGDGKADVLWRNSLTGMVYLWTMNGSTVSAETYVGTVDPAYDIVSTGDYDGDGKVDILWRHTTVGEVWVWLMNGATPVSQTYIETVDPGYVVQGSGDLNGDGASDLVWRHATGGDVWVWQMQGATRTVAYVDTVAELDYRIVGVADHTGDGQADILWHHATRGEVWLWPMTGTTRVSQSYVGAVPETDYRIVGSGDYDGDGKADVLWHHATRGEVWVWLMNGAAKLSETYVGSVPDVGYQIVRR